MRTILKLAALTMFGAMLFAQDDAAGKEQPKFFNLEFVVKEVDSGKVLNSRAYSLLVSADISQSMVRAGGKVPFPTSGGFQFFDVGVNIDCRNAHEQAGHLWLNVGADVSSIAAAENNTTGAPPVVRQNRWNSNVIVPLKKTTTIFSSDDPSSKRKMQLDLTATPIG